MLQQPSKEVLVIENENLVPPWLEEFHFLTEGSFFLVIRDALSTNGEISGRQRIILFHRALILHWLVRLKWDSKHKIPVPRGHKDDYKPFGELYKAVLELCQDVHLLNPCGYANPAIWFRHVLIEAAVEGVNHNQGKKHAIVAMQHENRQLASFENPFDRNAFPHTWMLIEVAMRQAETLNQFHKFRYRPFITARQKLVKAFADPSMLGYRWEDSPSGRQAFLQQGQGKSKRAVESTKLSRFETRSE